MAGKAAPSGWVYAAVAVSLFVAGYGVGGRVGRPGGPNIYTPRAQVRAACAACMSRAHCTLCAAE